jgi:hypothetical protein
MHRCAALVLVAAMPAIAQEFDAASIKPAAIARAGGEGSRRNQINVTPTSLTMINVSLGAAVEWAYSVRGQQVSGSGWTVEERYDIAGRSERPVTRDEMRASLRALLAGRFKLELAHESRVVAVCELIRGRRPLAIRWSETMGPATIGVHEGGFVFERTSMLDSPSASPESRESTARCSIRPESRARSTSRWQAQRPPRAKTITKAWPIRSSR